MSEINALGRRCLELEQELQYYRDCLSESYGANGTDLSLYLDFGTGFSEQQKLHRPIMLLSCSHVAETFILPENVCAVRIDPGELPCLLTNVVINAEGVQPMNGVILPGGGYFFTKPDPMIYVERSDSRAGKVQLSVAFDYRPIPVQKDTLAYVLCDELLAVLDSCDELAAAYQKEQEIMATERARAEKLNHECAEANSSARCWKEQFEQARITLQQIQNSSVWRLSALFRKLGALLRRDT